MRIELDYHFSCSLNPERRVALPCTLEGFCSFVSSTEYQSLFILIEKIQFISSLDCISALKFPECLLMQQYDSDGQIRSLIYLCLIDSFFLKTVVSNSLGKFGFC